jgi:hypothetical protein
VVGHCHVEILHHAAALTVEQQPQYLQQLVNALQDEWNNIPQQAIQTLISSMGRRCQAVIDSRDIFVDFLIFIHQRCSIGLRSGDLDGQGSTATLEFVSNAVVILAVWGRALSC